VKQRASLPAPAGGRRIVVALDYQHLAQLRRVEVLEQARRTIIQDEMLPGEELMIVALNGGLRVEQPFTADREQVLRSLRRMQYDMSLWSPSFSHMSEEGFVGGMTALFDLLGTYPGHKAVVLFSEMTDVPLDSQFRAIAAQAAAARCSIYPVDATGLRPPQPGSG
jgi:VWFA-related protein